VVKGAEIARESLRPEEVRQERKPISDPDWLSFRTTLGNLGKIAL
jgi:hypothetical protein